MRRCVCGRWVRLAFLRSARDKKKKEIGMASSPPPPIRGVMPVMPVMPVVPAIPVRPCPSPKPNPDPRSPLYIRRRSAVVQSVA
jgi:hypothetical protein